MIHTGGRNVPSHSFEYKYLPPPPFIRNSMGKRVDIPLFASPFSPASHNARGGT